MTPVLKVLLRGGLERAGLLLVVTHLCRVRVGRTLAQNVPDEEGRAAAADAADAADGAGLSGQHCGLQPAEAHRLR